MTLINSDITVVYCGPNNATTAGTSATAAPNNSTLFSANLGGFPNLHNSGAYGSRSWTGQIPQSGSPAGLDAIFGDITGQAHSNSDVAYPGDGSGASVAEIYDYRVIAILVDPGATGNLTGGTFSVQQISGTTPSLGDCTIEAYIAQKTDTFTISSGNGSGTFANKFTFATDIWTAPTDPNGSVTWTNVGTGSTIQIPSTAGSGSPVSGVGTLAPGDILYIALRRNIASGVTAHADTLIFQLSGNTI